jgi:DNA repair exonuclease SbcCD nuclease subunit
LVLTSGLDLAVDAHEIADVRGGGVKFIHTADWQIGKVFRFVPQNRMPLLQQARLDAIGTIGVAAGKAGATTVLVAGDVFDMEGLGDRTLAQPFERMRAFPGVTWHLIPGNHDPHRPDGLWDRARRRGLPANVQVHLQTAAVEIDGGAWLLPCPLQARHTLRDATQWTQEAATPQGALRIGIAHGTIREFGNAGERPNYIPPDRAKRSALDWLALGDWHGAMRIDPRTAYSGTPEIDSFDVQDGGGAFLVDIPAPGAEPVVERIEIGRYRWQRHQATLASAEDIRILEHVLDSYGAASAETLLRLTVRGALSYTDLELFDRVIRRRADAGLFDAAIDDSALLAEPTEEDLRSLAVQGPVGVVAARLVSMDSEADPQRRALAKAALRRLFVEYRLAEGQS